MTLTFISVFLITNVSVYVSTEGSLHAPMLRLLVGHRLFSDIFLFYTHNKHRPQTCDQSVTVLLCLAWPLACTTCTHTHTHTHTHNKGSSLVFLFSFFGCCFLSSVPMVFIEGVLALHPPSLSFTGCLLTATHAFILFPLQH